MWETPDFVTETMSVLFWVSWLVLFYLAWPRLASSGRNILRKRSPGKPVKLTIPPLRPRWDRVLEQGLGRLTRLCLGLSVLELLFRRPQFERLSLPVFGLCLGLLLLLRGWRHHFRPSLERSEILFPQVMDNTALGMGLLKVQELLEKLRQIAGELISKEECFRGNRYPTVRVYGKRPGVLGGNSRGAGRVHRASGRHSPCSSAWRRLLLPSSCWREYRMRRNCAAYPWESLRFLPAPRLDLRRYKRNGAGNYLTRSIS